MKKIDESILREVTRRLVVEFQPEKVFLFGSYAWGIPNEESDLDLFVIVPFSKLSPAKRAVRAYRCLRDLNLPKDILVRTREEVEKYKHVYASLECEILEKGKLLYG